MRHHAPKTRCPPSGSPSLSERGPGGEAPTRTNPDTAFIGRLLAPDFLYIAADGSVNDRRTVLRAVSNPNSVLNPFQTQDVRVRQYGKNTMILTGWFQQTGTWLGQPFALRLRYTDVYVKLKGRWQAVSAQAAVLPARKS